MEKIGGVDSDGGSTCGQLHDTGPSCGALSRGWVIECRYGAGCLTSGGPGPRRGCPWLLGAHLGLSSSCLTPLCPCPMAFQLRMYAAHYCCRLQMPVSKSPGCLLEVQMKCTSPLWGVQALHLRRLPAKSARDDTHKQPSEQED